MKDNKNIRRFFSLLLSVALLVTTMPASISSAKAVTTQFAGGSGTEADPYLIETKEHLNNVRYHLNAHFKMITDIEFTDADFAEGGAFYANGAGWVPIKSPTSNYTYFTGVFDGNGYSIYNLQINVEPSMSTSIGLFYQNNGTIKNLGVKDGSIFLTLSCSGFQNIGAIVGRNQGSISSCFSTFKVETKGSTGSAFVGGIAGYNVDGTITNCYNAGMIYAYDNAGGIAGYNSGGNITNCYNTGMIQSYDKDDYSYDNAGGIAGYNVDGSITNCYNTGMIYSTYSAGGITGCNSSTGTIENCFNTGFIRAENGDNSSCFAGGICGTNHNIVSTCYNIGYISALRHRGGITGLLVNSSNPEAKIKNCYYLVDESQSVGADDDGATKCKKEHMAVQSTFSGFDFENIWTMSISSDYLYPELIGNRMNFTKKVQGIIISSLPHKTEYYVGLEDLDITGAKLTRIYNDGTLEEIPVEPSMVTGYDKTKVGQQTITITYGGENLTFEVTNLSLVYDYKLTTDETITLEYEANKDFDFIISDETIAKITNVSSSTITWGSSIKKKSAATISPLKPGYVIVRAIDTTGNVLSKSLLLIEEGNHKMELIETIKKANCTEAGEEKYECVFCGFTEKRFPIALGHKEVIDNKVEPTCTKTGLTEGKHCSRCEKVLIKQEVIDATGVHIWDKGTTNKSGNILYNCDTCDGTYSKKLVSIKVTTKPNKLNYFEDENMDFTGMVVTAYYDNNTNAQMTAWSAGYSMMEGKQTVTVECYGKTDKFTITVNLRVPSNVTSSKHTISGSNISKIAAGTTVSSLLSGLNEGSYCKVFKGNSEVNGSTAVGTGMVVKIMDGSTAKASYTTIVTGDTNGDGNITVTDMIAIKAHVLKKSTLSGVYATAADTNGDSGISITDFIQVKAKILGKGTITAR